MTSVGRTTRPTRTLGACLGSALLPLAVACGGGGVVDPPPAQAVAVEVEREFELKVGQTASLENLRVTLRAVPEDSRCPIDAVCVWQGNARVVLDVRPAPEEPAAIVSLNTGVPPDQAELHGYRLRLTGVLPAAHSDATIPPDAYSALLVIGR